MRDDDPTQEYRSPAPPETPEQRAERLRRNLRSMLGRHYPATLANLETADNLYVLGALGAGS